MPNLSCSSCGELKSTFHFSKRSDVPRGHKSNCKSCISISSRKSYKSKPRPEGKAFILLRDKGVVICTKCKSEKSPEEFYNSSKSKTGKVSNCKSCMKEVYQINKNSYAIRGRKNHLKSKYNITIEQFEAIAKSQQYRCKCCNKEAKLYVDHIHNTKIIRGLLCQKCNSGIGLLGDNIEGIKCAMIYLEGEYVGKV